MGTPEGLSDDPGYIFPAASNPLVADLAKDIPMDGSKPPGPIFHPPHIGGNQESRPKRPLWSTLSSDSAAAAQMSKSLHDAYRQMTESSIGKLSLYNQAFIHQYYCCPVDSRMDVHSSWYFLPWHRAFLYFHERILQSVLMNNDFRLPVWDWESKPGQAVPTAYADLPVCGPGGIKPSDDPRRSCLPRPIKPCTVAAWLLSQDPARFMGRVFTTTNVPSAGDGDGGPHAFVHGTLNGFLYDLNTAAIDPLFYAHHANVDRFFQVWLNRYHDTTHQLPSPSRLPKSPLRYPRFFDRTGELVTVDLADFVDSDRMPYNYDLTSPASTFFGWGSHSFDSLRDLVSGLELPVTLNVPEIIVSGAAALANLVTGIAVKLLNALGNALDLPFAITFVKPEMVQPGTAYLVSLKVGNAEEQIGGFATFPHQKIKTITAYFCVSGAFLRAIVDQKFQTLDPASIIIRLAPASTEKSSSDIITLDPSALVNVLSVTYLTPRGPEQAPAQQPAFLQKILGIFH